MPNLKPISSASPKYTELFNRTRHAKLFKDAPPKDLAEEFRRIQLKDLSQPLDSVDANHRLKTLIKNLHPLLGVLEAKVDDADGAIEIVRSIVKKKIELDAGGPEIRSILSGKSDADIQSIANGPSTGESILVALASPIAELLGVKQRQRETIQQTLIERNALYQEATEMKTHADAELSDVQNNVREVSENIEASIQAHRVTHPGLMAQLEK